MRIAYVTLHWPRTVESSTGKKILRHIRDWRKAGHEVRFFSHRHAVSPSENLLDADNFVYSQYPGMLGRLRTEISRIRAARKLVSVVSAYQPDLIYLRWSMYVFPVHKLLRIAPTWLK